MHSLLNDFTFESVLNRLAIIWSRSACVS